MSSGDADESIAAFVPPRGSLVEAVGLKSSTSLNGKRGVFNGKVQEGRLGIDFKDAGTKALRGENIVLLREGCDDASMPQRFPAPALGVSAAARRRVLAYGDSLTAGYYAMGRAFSAYALSMVRGLLPEIAADVWVCGLSALTAGEMLDGLDDPDIEDGAGRFGRGLRVLLAEKGPFDLALIMAGTNDLGSKRAVAEDVAQDIIDLHSVCHSTGIRTVALSVPPNEAVNESRRYRAKWQKTNTILHSWVEKEKNALLFVNTSDLVPFDIEKLWEDDGLHFSPEGSERLGAGLAPLVVPLLREPVAIEGQDKAKPDVLESDGADDKAC